MNDIKLANALGWFSLGLGVVGIVAGGRVARLLGIDRPGLVRLFGAREIASGVGVLAYPDNPKPLLARAAGDALDLAVLASTLGAHHRHRRAAGWVTAGVVGVTLLDLFCAASLAGREHSALQTARRTRVSRAESANF